MKTPKFLRDWPEVAYRPGIVRDVVSVLFWLCVGFFSCVLALAVWSVITRRI